MRRTGGIVSTSFAVDAVELNFMILLYYLEVRRRYSPQTKRIRNRIAGTNIPFSTMLIIILPGGVTHALAGCCIAAIIIPVTPTTPLKVKKPPLINLFIIASSYKNIMIPNVISTQRTSSPFHSLIGTGSPSRMVGIFFFEPL